ncbi:NAD-dependent epimerase/dehydratase family protein [Winogradskyella sp. A3E31]|uniref:NAD-dependent epimerase/dehydratase family protein n=1 Tax=Winogradskyella sp. A3E31 TaxID=3349637 RepID=UPI00398B678D
MILVTGGTGLVGSHLLFRLVSENKTVRAIYRREHKLEKVRHVFSYFSDKAEELYQKIEWVEADLTDIPKLEDAFRDITHVYHCAAFVSFEPDKYRTLRRINIGGTANIVNLCVHHKVEKLVYVSSVAAIGHTANPEDLIKETTPWNPEEDNSVYAITKYGAELEVWRGSQEGLSVIIVNPGVVIGGGYWRGGSSGSLFTRVFRGNKYYTSGSTGYVDVFDVANPMIQLMESPIENERFILVSENLSFRAFNDSIAEHLNVPKTTKRVKPWQLSIGWRLDWLNHKLFGKRRKLTKQLAKTLNTTTKYDNHKVKAALNYEFKPVEDAIRDTCQLFLEDLNDG